MKKEYLPKIIEPYIQNIWKKNNTFKVTEDKTKEKFYCLSMIPYPSGKLHMGHVRNYTISDVIARYQRMLGKNVLHPIGWDAFGLPAENAAIQNNTQPSTWTYKNINYMKKQLKLLGFSYDWDREITTCKPNYYKWEQWFFIQLYKKNLVYKKKSWVNWCEYDQTVLANEQVLNELCWRCNNKVVKKKIFQWFIKITQYAEELLNDLDTLTQWPKKVKVMQSNWIGRVHGIKIKLNLVNSNEHLNIFTPNADALVKTTFILISSSHKLAIKLAHKNIKIKKFITQLLNKNNSFNSKGIKTNEFAIHPITQKKLPIWITNYILSNYETKTKFCVPKDNENDLNFAIKNNIEIESNNFELNNNIVFTTYYSLIKQNQIAFDFKKYNQINNNKEKNAMIINYLINNKIGKKYTTYRLKDWGVSRQRYWGTPIPMATLKNNQIISIPEKYLPIILPELIDINHKKKLPINKNNIARKININGQTAICESDTFDTFLESSWYYARFTCSNFHKGMIDTNNANYWLPIDQYIGGIEHAVMHLMYFRFVHKLLRDLGLVNSNEPVKKLLCQGMVLSNAFYYFDKHKQKKWISEQSIQVEYDSNNCIKPSFYFDNKKIYYEGMIKMSKSKNNGIEPETIIKKYGADTIRLFIMFSAPIENSLEWKESGVKGMYRFLKKIWNLVYTHIKTFNINIVLNTRTLTDTQREIYSDLHKTIQIVSNHINTTQSFNIAISEIIKFVNKLISFSKNHERNQALIHESLLIIIKMLYPFVPHFSFSLWMILSKNNKNIDCERWPTFDQDIIIHNSKCTIIVQINGKKRHTVLLSKSCSQKKMLNFILKEQKIKKYIALKKIKKIIYVPFKIINLVLQD